MASETHLAINKSTCFCSYENLLGPGKGGAFYPLPPTNLASCSSDLKERGLLNVSSVTATCLLCLDHTNALAQSWRECGWRSEAGAGSFPRHTAAWATHMALGNGEWPLKVNDRHIWS